MKLDPGMHIGMHLISFGKSGVTQVERASGMVLDALKKRLHDAANTKGGKWIKELPNAL
jgi:hypothetical protein